MTMTGNIYNNKPISDNPDLLNLLWSEMGKGSKYIPYDGNAEQKHSDFEIMEMAKNATNGVKFISLLSEDWKNFYTSQSEADFAFIDIIAFYTQNKEQIKRIFHSNLLGQRAKAKRVDYLNYMIARAFDKQVPPVNLEMLNNEVAQMQTEAKIKKIKPDRIPSKEIDVNYKVTFPKGLVGEIANYIYQSSYRPVPEIALAGALAMMAGITGRAYNVSDQGLNLYILMLAKTGRGKEAMAAKTTELMNYVCKSIPSARDLIGPGDYASGQGLTRYLSNNPLGSAFTIAGEFGLKMQTLSDPKANAASSNLKQMLLDLYHKSGKNNSYKPVVYSDKEKNTKELMSPALTILGESTPSSLYDNLSEENITNGLLPRFLTIEYLGERVNPNEQHGLVKPSPELLQHLLSVVSCVMTLTHGNVVNDVRLTPEAAELSKAFDLYCTSQINNNDNEALGELWNRSHIKALRVAAIISVGMNENFPCIDADTMQWSIDLIMADTKRVCWRFEKGKIGKPNDDNAQIETMIGAIKDYILKPYKECAYKYDKSKNGELLYTGKKITYVYFSRKLQCHAAFKHDKLGATAAIKKCIQSMIDIGLLAEIPRHQAKDMGTTGRLFMLLDRELLGN
jgi:hypothetical protein